MEIKTVEVNKLAENNWNPNILTEKKFTALVDHVKRKGMVQPILVRPYPKKEEELNDFEKETLKDSPWPEFEIIDGAHRWKAAKEAGLKEINCVVVEMDEPHAKMATIAMNNIKGYMQDLPLAAIISELNKDHNLDELSKELAFEERELKSYIKMLEAPEDFSNLVEHPEDRPITLTFVVWPNQEKVITEALEKTGVDSKSKALATVCKGFLEQKN